jgi:enoyl-CoA hydratase/carnithine racemase
VNERVGLTVTDGVAEVRMSRPEKRNALDPAMFAALVETGTALARDRSVRAVVLSGEGPDFCAGLDRSSFHGFARGERPSASVTLPPTDGPAHATGQRAAHVWRELEVPVIAAVQGHALGGGLQIALGADLRIVAPNARLAVLEIHWGLVPDMTGTQVLPDLVGRDVATELTLTGRIVRGDEAVELGLATRTADDPRAAALALAGEIAGHNPDAVRWAVHLLGLAGRVDAATGFAAEQEAMAALIGSPNQAEAVAARFDRRPGSFTDRP